MKYLLQNPNKAFTPMNKTGAISLLTQAEKAMLNGTKLPDHVANYLLYAIYKIKAGESANTALCLQGSKGQPPKRKRDFQFAQCVEKYKKENESSTDTDAIKALCKIHSDNDEYQIGNEFMTLKAINSLLKNGRVDLDFYKDISEALGEKCANDFAQFIIQALEK